MRNLQSSNEYFKLFGNWDWQPKRLKAQFGQLTLSDVKFEVGKEDDLFARIGIRLNKTLPEVMNIFKKLKPF